MIIFSARVCQGLLELLWTVYSEEELQFLKLRNFENPFNKDMSVGIRNTMHKKGLKLAPVVELAKLNFTHITVLK